jgi:hypothetical protein
LYCTYREVQSVCQYALQMSHVQCSDPRGGGGNPALTAPGCPPRCISSACCSCPPLLWLSATRLCPTGTPTRCRPPGIRRRPLVQSPTLPAPLPAPATALQRRAACSGRGTMGAENRSTSGTARFRPRRCGRACRATTSPRAACHPSRTAGIARQRHLHRRCPRRLCLGPSRPNGQLPFPTKPPTAHLVTRCLLRARPCIRTCSCQCEFRARWKQCMHIVSNSQQRYLLQSLKCGCVGHCVDMSTMQARHSAHITTDQCSPSGAGCIGWSGVSLPRQQHFPKPCLV